MGPTEGDETTTPTKAEGSQGAELEGDSKGKVQFWLKEIAEARGREKDWRRAANSAVALYEGSKKVEYQFNILYSNTEILAPALYNQLPRPVVVRRFKDEDAVGKVAAEVVKRLLIYLCDTNEAEYPDFDSIMIQGVLEALVPGRGIARFKHEVEFCEGVEGEKIQYETVVGEHIPWDRFTHGYAKQWKSVPWIAFDHYMSRDECVRNFGKERGALIALSETEKDSEESGKDDKWKSDDRRGGPKLALIHEIWNKVTKTVIFVSPGFPDEYIKEVEDPLHVTGFFAMPEPLRLFAKIKTLTPTTLYTQYEEQARELNRLTTRINRIINACKVRGMYDARIGGIEQLLKQDDNAVVPVENMSQLDGSMQNLERVIWLMPIDKLVAVLQQLYSARQECKAVIYEIMGISDILRGASKASETLGAQQIKDQWGSLRVSRLQKLVQKFARNAFRVMAEIAVTNLSQETIAKITGLGLPTREEKAGLQQAVQAFAQAQNQAPPGAPPPQPPPQLQEAMKALQKPAWEDILDLLKGTLSRTYRIDIETNSTIDPEATDDKQQIVELMNAMAQLMAGLMPMVQEGVLTVEAAKGILKTTVRRFRFGDEIESYLDEIGKAAPKADPKLEAQKAQAQMDVQMKQMDMKMAQEKAQMDMALAQKKAELESQSLAQESEFKRLEHGLKMAELQAKLQAQQQELAMKQEAARMDHAMGLEAGRAKTDSAVQMAKLKTQAAAAKPKGNP